MEWDRVGRVRPDVVAEPVAQLVDGNVVVPMVEGDPEGRFPAPGPEREIDPELRARPNAGVPVAQAQVAAVAGGPRRHVKTFGVDDIALPGQFDRVVDEPVVLEHPAWNLRREFVRLERREGLLILPFAKGAQLPDVGLDGIAGGHGERQHAVEQRAPARERQVPRSAVHPRAPDFRVMRRFDRPPIELRLEQPEQFGPEGFEARLRSDEQEHRRPFVERQPGKVGVGLILGQARPELRLDEHALLALPVVNRQIGPVPASRRRPALRRRSIRPRRDLPASADPSAPAWPRRTGRG